MFSCLIHTTYGVGIILKPILRIISVRVREVKSLAKGRLEFQSLFVEP